MTSTENQLKELGAQIRGAPFAPFNGLLINFDGCERYSFSFFKILKISPPKISVAYYITLRCYGSLNVIYEE